MEIGIYEDFNTAYISFAHNDKEYICVRHSGGKKITPHSHSRVNEWVVVKEGDFTVTLEKEKRSFNLHEGWMTIFFPAGKKHSLVPETKTSYFVFRDKKG